MDPVAADRRIRPLATLLAGFAIAVANAPAQAWEADVHFGLTRWLALRAGFSAPEAEAIALGDQRVDGGLVESVQLSLEYACAGRFADVARHAQHEHYPAATPVPAAPAARIVRPGDASARVDLRAVAGLAKGKEGALLAKLGEALHPLQDSWSHQGEPARLVAGGAVDCDPMLASGHPLARGGPDSHAADLTAPWPADTLAMAEASYAELTRYGLIDGRPRTAAPWPSITTAVEAFARARTKTDKRAWFVAQGLADTRFLEGISLPDGADPGPLDWSWRRLPPPPGTASMQHDAPADARGFFDRLLARWLGAEPVERIVADMGPGTAAERAELVARLALWRQKDHGRAAELAHAPGRLNAAQLKAVARLVRDPASALPATTVLDSMLALQPSTPEPMPMLPYIVRSLPGGRLIAIARLKHAPYDSVGWIAERRGDRWVLAAMIATVDP